MLSNGTSSFVKINASPGPNNSKSNGHLISQSNSFIQTSVFLGILSIAFIAVIYTFFSLTATAQENALPPLRFPTSIEDLHSLDITVTALSSMRPLTTIAFFCALYISKQAFSIPGSLILNLLAGKLYPIYIAFPLVCTLTMIGASCCFTLSKSVAKRLLSKCCPDRIKSMGKSMESHKSDLLWYLTFLRLVPMSPNWLINITAPIVGVPFFTFALSVFIGLMPYNFICVEAGSILSTIKSKEDILTPWNIIKLSSLAILAMIPILVKRIIARRSPTNNEPILPR